MGSLYLDWLDDAVDEAANATGYDWAYYDDDWLHRSRSSGGYDSAPLCVMWHHTAGADNAWGDATYQCESSDSRPTSNITIDSKIAILCAGGATNTNGSGINSPMSFSRGTVAEDDMNRRAVGLEICNNGVGAPYSEKTINFLIALSNGINRRCGNQPTDLCTHAEYAPDRKIDPSRADAVEGPWKPGSINSSGTWNVGDLRAECKRRWDTKPTPEPEPEPEGLSAVLAGDDETMFISKNEKGIFFIGTGLVYRQLLGDEVDKSIDRLGLKDYFSGKTVTARNQVSEADQKLLGIRIGQSSGGDEV